MNPAMERRHRVWLAGGRNHFNQQLNRISRQTQEYFSLTQHLLMLLTLEPALVESLRQTMIAQPIVELRLNLAQTPNDRSCPHPPSDDLKEARLLELCHLFAPTIQSFTVVSINSVTFPAIMILLDTCTHLETLDLARFALAAAELESIVRAIGSVQTLQRLTMTGAHFLTQGAADAFSFGIDASSLVYLELQDVIFPEEHAEQVAMALARSTTLVHLEYANDRVSNVFFDAYTVALSTNENTRMERLWLGGRENREIDLRGKAGSASGPDAVVLRTIRNLLFRSIQQRVCPPLFSAIGSAISDRECIKRMVKAFTTAEVDESVLFDYLSTNQYNLNKLIHDYGKSRKRKRNDDDDDDDDDDE